MKFFTSSLLVLFLFSNILLKGTFAVSLPDTNNVVIELSTGTWCQWCPCGHIAAEAIADSFPNAFVIIYHGGADPYANFNGNLIMQQLVITGYPTGTIGRKTGLISRELWYNEVASQSADTPGVRIEWTKEYNISTRELTITVNCTPLKDLTGNYFLNYVLLEDNLIYPQQGNSSCTGGQQYVHNKVARDMINGSLGELLNSDGIWNTGETKTNTLTYTVSNDWQADNCTIGCFVYKQTLPLAVKGLIMQSKKEALVKKLTGIKSNDKVFNFTLEQNYPNPFNPETNIRFTIPKEETVSLKIYDVLGKELETYFDKINLASGTYTVTFNASKYTSGTYFYKLQTNESSQIRKMVLIK